MAGVGASPELMTPMTPDRTTKGGHFGGVDKDHTCDVHFSIRASLLPGQHIRVLGSESSLGWDPNHGLVLCSTGPDGASDEGWEGSVDLPTFSSIEYKFVVCDRKGFCYSLSPVRKLLTKNKRVLVDDGELSLSAKLKKSEAVSELERPHTGYQLQVQLEIDSTHVVKPGHPQLGITLYDGSSSQVGEVIISLRASTTELESVIRRKNDYNPAVFRYTDSASVKALYFEVRSSSSSLMGKASTLFSQLSHSHHGFAAIPLIDESFSLVGEVSFRYLVVTPFTHPHIIHTEAPSRMAFPTPNSSSTLLIGHRGTGAAGSRTPVEGKVRSHIRENTVLSFASAGAQGAQLVEFDVHLTSDLVPVIYHDFSTHEKDAQVPIHSMTFQQFKSVGKRQVSKAVSLEDVNVSTSPLLPIHDMFPTLREVLQKVPSHIGFNVEIKYPIQDEVTYLGLHPVDRNTYLDAILWEIFEHAKNRFIVFSSFDPEICLMLMVKQPRYPVLFLTEMGTHLRSDPRANSPEASLSFAKSAGLGGLVGPAKFLLSNPDVVKRVHESGLKVCTWGKENNDPKNVHFQKKMGVDGIITDHVGHIHKHWEEKQE